LRYNPPGGAIEPGETLVDGLKREILEETSLEISVQGILGIREWEASRHGAYYVTVFFACKPVSFDTTIVLNDENCEYMWASSKTIADLELMESSLGILQEFLASSRRPLLPYADPLIHRSVRLYRSCREERCTCPGPGPLIRPGAPRRASRWRQRSRPSRDWPGGGSAGHWMRGSRPPASPAMRCTALTRACADLERRQVGYVLAVAASHPVSTAAGPCQARTIAARLPCQAWQRYSAGHGARGTVRNDWAWLAVDPGRPGHRWLLIRRNRRTRELAFYRCYSPAPSRWPCWSRSPESAGPRRRISRPARD
jgi:ADP-ribose pyrophosphatase YjhB (NUDIX family)